MDKGTIQELNRIHYHRPPYEWPHEHPSSIYPGLCYWTAGGNARQGLPSERGHMFPVIYFELKEWNGRKYAEPLSKEADDAN